MLSSFFASDSKSHNYGLFKCIIVSIPRRVTTVNKVLVPSRCPNDIHGKISIVLHFSEL